MYPGFVRTFYAALHKPYSTGFCSTVKNFLLLCNIYLALLRAPYPPA
jgi:hypothetical protein